MKTTEMKEILFNKLKAENTYFTKSDLSIKKVSENKYIITVKDYEHITFTLTLEYDNYFKYMVWVTDNEHHIISDSNSYTDYDIKHALINLGYHIANTF